MSEEIRNPGTELSDAALEGVSGGHTAALQHLAEGLCMSCWRQCGEKKTAELAEYMYHYGTIRDSVECPFLREAGKG